ncbi:MAG: hypothetical protein WCC66_10255 [Rhizobiaceae bacterium]
MKNILLPILVATVFVCIGFMSVGPVMKMLEKKPELDEPEVSYETVKSEFISVSVFESGMVKGYLSFRLEVEIADTSRIAEVTYHASDFMFRRNISYEELKSSKNDNPSKYKSAIQNAIKDRINVNLVRNLDVIDFSFDLRL